MLDKELLNLLACPICKKNIFLEREELICSNCHKAYPIQEGIPILLIEQARDILDEDKR